MQAAASVWIQVIKRPSISRQSQINSRIAPKELGLGFIDCIEDCCDSYNYTIHNERVNSPKTTKIRFFSLPAMIWTKFAGCGNATIIRTGGRRIVQHNINGQYHRSNWLSLPSSSLVSNYNPNPAPEQHRPLGTLAIDYDTALGNHHSQPTTVHTAASSKAETTNDAIAIRPIGSFLPSWMSSWIWLIKRTFQPSIIRKKRKMGFLVRQRTVGGRRVLNRRKAKGRARLAGA